MVQYQPSARNGSAAIFLQLNKAYYRRTVKKWAAAAGVMVRLKIAVQFF